MDLLNLFKNFCVALVLMQTFAILAVALMVTVEEHFFRNDQQRSFVESVVYDGISYVLACG